MNWKKWLNHCTVNRCETATSLFVLMHLVLTVSHSYREAPSDLSKKTAGGGFPEATCHPCTQLPVSKYAVMMLNWTAVTLALVATVSIF